MVAGFIAGVFSIFAGTEYTAGLLAFYISSSYFTKVGAEKKHKQEEDYRPGGQRNMFQVLATCGIGTIITIIIVLLKDAEFIYANNSRILYMLRLCYICHYCVVNGDTWASELGSIYGGIPRLIRTMKKVPPGTNGGVTLFGLAISFLGGAFVTFWFHALSVLLDAYPTFSSFPMAILTGGILGFCGSLVFFYISIKYKD